MNFAEFCLIFFVSVLFIMLAFAKKEGVNK